MPWVTMVVAIGIALVAAFQMYRHKLWQRYGAFEYACVCYVVAAMMLMQVVALDPDGFPARWQEYAQPVGLALTGVLLAAAMSLHAIATVYGRTRPNHWVVPVVLALIVIHSALNWLRNQWRGTGGLFDAETPAGRLIWLLTILFVLGGLMCMWAAVQKRCRRESR